MTALGKHRIFFTAAVFFFGILITGLVRENLLLAFLSLILFAASIVGKVLFQEESANISTWKRCGLGTAETYPQSPQEWKNIQSSGWTERVLVDFAIKASYKFDRRKMYKERYEEILKVAKKPEELPPLRDTLKMARNNLKLSEKNAQKAMNQFLKIWDLFKENNVFPKKSTWVTADIFRQAAYQSYRYFFNISSEDLPPDHAYLHFHRYANILADYRLQLGSEDANHLHSCEICLAKLKNYLQVNELLL